MSIHLLRRLSLGPSFWLRHGRRFPARPGQVPDGDSKRPEGVIDRAQEEPVTAAAPPAKPVASLSAGDTDEKRARLPAVVIADLVLGELRKIDGFPKYGVSITAYGSQPWNAMITFAPFSTTPQAATRLRQALPDIVSRLRKYVEPED